MTRTFRQAVLAAPTVFFGLCLSAAHAQSLKLTPLHASGIYALGEQAGWTVTAADATKPPATNLTYTIKKNGVEPIKSGRIDLAAGKMDLALALNEPATLYLEIKGTEKGDKPVVAGAAIAPTKLQPSVARPADFDAFWSAKIAALHAIPADPVLTPGQSGKEGIDYATIRLNNLNGAHVYGQIATPSKPGKHPAILIMQWASPPYPLQKAWVTERAAEGFIALNVEPHDVPCDMPDAYYKALPQMIKSYNTIYDDDRDRCYFLQMYLGDYRALDYLTTRPDWDGKTLVVMGTSMGGQQSFCVAGLHPKVTHLIVHVPAGADSNALLHGRAAGYPNWNAKNPKVLETGLYFDTVNFAPHITAKCLVSIGFVDTIAVPVGIWTTFNQIAGPKEVVPLVDAAHNNLATEQQQRPYYTRSNEWLSALAQGREPEVHPLP